ncbi:hypothetical protein ACWDRX_25520, partial [Streptomyces nigra]
MIRTWRPARSPARTGSAARRPSAPVTHTLIALCVALFLAGPAAGLNPAFGTDPGIALGRLREVVQSPLQHQLPARLPGRR